MLLEEFDANKTAIINPDMCVEKIENFPEVTISCFSEELFNEVLEFFRAKEIASVHSASGLNPIYEVTYKGKRFAMFKSMVGEPLCVGQYEEIIAMGSKRLILLGNCGVLNGLKIVELLFRLRLSGMRERVTTMRNHVTQLM